MNTSTDSITYVATGLRRMAGVGAALAIAGSAFFAMAPTMAGASDGPELTPVAVASTSPEKEAPTAAMQPADPGGILTDDPGDTGGDTGGTTGGVITEDPGDTGGDTGGTTGPEQVAQRPPLPIEEVDCDTNPEHQDCKPLEEVDCKNHPELYPKFCDRPEKPECPEGWQPKEHKHQGWQEGPKPIKQDEVVSDGPSPLTKTPEDESRGAPGGHPEYPEYPEYPSTPSTPSTATRPRSTPSPPRRRWS